MQKDKTSEALSLAEEILRNIELNEIPFANTCLKVARLARLLNDTQRLDALTKISSSIGSLESYIEASKIRLAAARDPDVSVSSANPTQYLVTPIGNAFERDKIINNILFSEKSLQEQKTTVYNYVLNIYYELRFSAVPQEIFEKTRRRVDKRLAEMVPEAVKKFVSVYDNMKSTNPEDWSNAVHSCRRILQAVADVLYPPNPSGLSEINRGGKRIKVGSDNYVNRLIIYVENNSNSKRFFEVVGSQLKFLGDRLDSLYSAATKGSHTEIKSAEEAERYIIYTYLLIGDILWLSESAGTGI